MTSLKNFRALSLLFFALVFSSVVSAQNKVLTPELVMTIRTISNAQISPDGQWVVFQVARTRRDDERPGGSVNEIWIKLTMGNDEARRFTYNDRSDRAPAWSPDGKSVAFISQRGDSALAQIYLIQMAGGEAMQLTKAENSVTAFKWSPDGARIAYMMEDPKTKDEVQAEREGRDWTVADQNYKHTRLYVLDLNTKQSKLVTTQPLTIHDFDWSPDGTQFALAATDTPTVDDSYMKVKLMALAATGGDARLVVKTEGKLVQPRWSPDGKWIAWLGATAMNDSYPGSVFVVPASGGSARNLTPKYEGSAQWIIWQPAKPATILFGGIEREANTLNSISDLSNAGNSQITKALTNDAARTLIYNAPPSFRKGGGAMLFVANSPQHPNEIFYGESNRSPLMRLTHFNPQLDGLSLGEQAIVRWKSVDGMEIEGVLIKPVGYQQGQRYPTVLCPHGGPESADQNGWYGSAGSWGQMLAGRGIAAFYPNYRGSIGRGPAFAMGDHRDLMGKEFQDMLAGIDYLVSEGITDNDRVGIAGGSYGGYTSAWAATYASERFRAAVVSFGITNWYSMTGTSDIFNENSTVHWDLYMYDNYEIYWQRSPIAYIRKANTPTLIFHGAVDPRVPYGQSQELYTALKWKGVPVEFVTYPREGHGFNEKAHRYDYMTRGLAWLERYLNRRNPSVGSGNLRTR